MKRIVLIVGFVSIFIACSNTKNLTPQNFPIAIEYTEIGKGTLSGSGLEQLSETKIAINNQQDWNALLTKMNAIQNVSNQFTQQHINFNTHTVIIHLLKLKPNGCQITINNVVENEKDITVISKEVNFVTLRQTQPFHIISIPKTQKEIIFN